VGLDGAGRAAVEATGALKVVECDVCDPA
jgi:hypothetical protein